MNYYRQLVEVLFYLKFSFKKYIMVTLTSFGNFNYDCVIKTRKVFRFLSLINNSVTTELNLSLLRTSAIISSKTINILRYLFWLYSSMFL